MPKAYQLQLDDRQLSELVDLRDHHQKPYVRERAAAIIKVGAGQSIRQVALHGLLRSYEPEVISEWIRRYLAEGPHGLLIRKGRGRKPVFSPSERGRGESSR
jgi:hypothetical protein